MYMKLLITGSNGQLGSEVKKILKSKRTELGPIPDIFLSACIDCVDVEELDITNKEAVLVYVKKSEPNIIINCAAYTNVDDCEDNINSAFLVNAIGARNMAIVAEKVNAKLVHISTDYVFAGDGNKPYQEFDIPNPKSIYGASKNMGEQYVRDFCTRYYIVRTAWLYGYVGKNFVKTIMKVGHDTGSLKVVNDQVGNPTNAVDLAHHILKIAAKEEYGIYHCTGIGECTWFDFASKIIEYAGIKANISPCTTDEYQRTAMRPAYSALDNTMLRCTIGDEMRTWQEALKCFIKNYNQK